MHNVMDIKLVKKGVTILELVSTRIKIRDEYTHFRHGSSKDNNFIKLAHAFHELVNSRPLNDINVVVLSFYLNWDREVCLVKNLHLLLAVILP